MRLGSPVPSVDGVGVGATVGFSEGGVEMGWFVGSWVYPSGSGAGVKGLTGERVPIALGGG